MGPAFLLINKSAINFKLFRKVTRKARERDSGITIKNK